MGAEAVIPVLKLVNSAADVFPPLKSATGGALQIAELVQEFTSNKAEWENFRQYLLTALAHILWFETEPPEELKINTAKLATIIDEIIEEIKGIQCLKGTRRLLAYRKDPDKIVAMKAKFDDALKLFQLSASIMTETNFSELGKGIEDRLSRMQEKIREDVANLSRKSDLDKLPYVKNASWDPNRACLSGTREAIVSQTLAWIHEDEPASSIFWLVDVAGSGKTAVAHTIAQQCSKDGSLLTAFFFDRNDMERNKAIFSTIARDLSRVSTHLADQIALAVNQEQSLLSPPISRQFEALISKPSKRNPPDRPLVIIIDALDESRSDASDSRYTRDLLMLLRDEFKHLPPSIRVVITSRPDRDIDRDLSKQTHIHRQTLDIFERGNLDDVGKYARYRLAELAERNGLGGEWPGNELLEKFITRAEGLFIWVATVVNYLEGVTKPGDKLQRLVEDSTTSNLTSEQKMDELYSAILEQCPWDRDEDFARDYALAMGAILAAKDPLSVAAWQALQGDAIDVHGTLRFVGAILVGLDAEGQPLRILHQSFRDFTTSRASRSKDTVIYSIKEVEHSQGLALLCLKVLNKELARDIPGLGYLQELEKGQSIPKLSSHDFSEHLWYACQFWMEHLVDVVTPGPDLIEELKEFLEIHVISWVEISVSRGRFRNLERFRAWLEGNALKESIHFSPTQHTAELLFDLSSNLSYFARHGEALAAIQEAAALYRKLDIEHPETFTPHHASSLLNLSNRLSDFGRHREALAAIQEAVVLYRKLDIERLEMFIPDLALSLSNLSLRLSDFGRHREALVAIEDSVAFYRKLDIERPETFIPNLALSLSNLSIRLSGFGRHREALAAIQEAVALYRRLDVEHLETFIPNLSGSLWNLSNRLSDFGRHREALAAIEESVAFYRKLNIERPETFIPDLAASLLNLSNRLSDFGRHREALAAIEESVAFYRKLDIERPETFIPDLALSLLNLSNRLSDFRPHREALAAIQEAVALYRKLNIERPKTFIPDLARSLLNLSIRLSDFGRLGEALAAIQEAVLLYRKLDAERPETFLPDLALSLVNLSFDLSTFGRHTEALAAVQEAVTMYRPLAAAIPAKHSPKTIRSLKRLAECLSQLGRDEEAHQAREEAAEFELRFNDDTDGDADADADYTGGDSTSGDDTDGNDISDNDHDGNE